MINYFALKNGLFNTTSSRQAVSRDPETSLVPGVRLTACRNDESWCPIILQVAIISSFQRECFGLFYEVCYNSPDIVKRSSKSAFFWTIIRFLRRASCTRRFALPRNSGGHSPPYGLYGYPDCPFVLYLPYVTLLEWQGLSCFSDGCSTDTAGSFIRHHITLLCKTLSGFTFHDLIPRVLPWANECNPFGVKNKNENSILSITPGSICW